ncbi:anti-sigma-I factor RsgI family protein [Slackia isoflavoniconvertens]|uniref:anti-sigma-I factor RsgI family protein n=1 Tax=Slackia isoflavoniconvertens TaxID=572010 RepID=UPI003FD8BC69
MANNEEHQVKEAFKAIHLPNNIAARTLASIEAKREQRESERTEELMAAQETRHSNKIAGQEAKTAEEPSGSQTNRHAIGASKGLGSNAPQKRRKALRFAKGERIAAIAACLALVACLIGGVADFLRPMAYVGIDVNPSVELTLNRFDVVVGTCALNDDGQRALDEVPCMWRAFDDAARDLDGAMRAIAGEGAVVEVSIDCDNEGRYAALAAQSNDCFGCNGEAHCDRTNAEERQAAHDSGMGVAKYRAYQALQEAGVDLSAEECASMSMRELRDMLAENGIAEDEEKDGHTSMGYGRGRGDHNGNGAGGHDHGSGSGNGNGKHTQK